MITGYWYDSILIIIQTAGVSLLKKKSGIAKCNKDGMSGMVIEKMIRVF